MAVKNDPSRRYANGSIGTVVDFEPATEYPIVEFLNGKTVTMQPDTWELRDGDKKRASLSQIPLRLAFALTVHKSQGSEFSEVLLALPESPSPPLTRALFYTGITRAKHKVDIWGLPARLAEAVNTRAERAAGLAQRLRSEFSDEPSDLVANLPSEQLGLF